ncbi:MAG: 1-acyl-sn-glycerol-3-phosphate acyltransferase [Gammaproteobacteria bacterium]|nr:1-acyl-sn-glycerol-3-phosphate acyltransferase [Gammaproteobacteria bacterium]
MAAGLAAGRRPGSLPPQCTQGARLHHRRHLRCETLGVLAAFWILLRYRGGRGGEAARVRWLEANYELQGWWCRSLKRAAQWLFRLRFEVEGTAPPGGDGVIMLLRHCSIGDTLIPVVFHCEPTGQRLRFVLKQELLFDPCLDIVGNRLPNYFADRGSGDTAREVEGVTRLLDNLPRDQGVLIYPEGTRFTPAKREAILRRLEQKGRARRGGTGPGLDPTAAAAARWTAGAAGRQSRARPGVLRPHRLRGFRQLRPAVQRQLGGHPGPDPLLAGAVRGDSRRSGRAARVSLPAVGPDERGARGIRHRRLRIQDSGGRKLARSRSSSR